MSDGSSRSSSAGLIAVAVGIVAAAFLVAGAVRDVGRKNDVIEVTGSARRAIVADLGIWKGTVTVQSPTVAGSYARGDGVRRPGARVAQVAGAGRQRDHGCVRWRRTG